MKIVVLDGHTLNPGDLSWDALRGLGECTIHERTSADLRLERARGADAVLTNKVVLDRPLLSQLPGLRYVGVLATGYNVVDVAAALDQGITVTNVPAYSTLSVAQMTFALLMELTNHTGHHAGAVRSGRWTRNEDVSFWDYPLTELAGLTMGLVGFGNIAQAVANVALAFDMKVLVHVRSARPVPPGIRLVDLDALFQSSDIVSLHCPLTPENAGMVNAARLALMKPSAFLLNTARGGLVIEADLAEALNEGRLAGAGLDVLAAEPADGRNPLLSAKHCVITPHIAWATKAARARLMHEVVGNLRAFVQGKPLNVVAGPFAGRR